MNTKRAHSKKERRALGRAVVFKVVVVVLLLAATALAPLVVNNAIGYIPLITVLCAIAAAFIYLQILKRSLDIQESSDQRDCPRGTSITFHIGFINRAPLFFFRMKAYFYTTDLFGNVASQASTTLALSPKETRQLDFSARFEHIGTYEAGLEKVVISDFFSLFTHTVVNEHHYQIQVTPKISPIEHVEFSNEAVLESAKPVMTILSDSLDYSGVREYRPGDPLKTIHWKLSAHTRETYTRVFELYTNPGAAVLFDFFARSSEADVLMGMFDAIVETGFSVEQYCRMQGMETELLYYDKYGERVRRAGYHSDEVAEIVGDMPRISAAKGEADILSLISEQSASVHAQNNLIICSANLSSELISALIEAKARRKEPILFAVVPRSVIGREREIYTKNLLRLDAAGIGYVILSQSDELAGNDRK